MKFGYYMASWQESEWGNVRFFLSHWSFQNFTISQRRWLKASSIDFVVDIGMMKQGCFMFELDCMILHSAGVDWFNKVLSSRRWCILVGEDDARVMWTLVTLVNWLGVDNRDSKATIIYDSMTERCDSERLALMWVETTWNQFFGRQQDMLIKICKFNCFLFCNIETVHSIQGNRPRGAMAAKAPPKMLPRRWVWSCRCWQGNDWIA